MPLCFPDQFPALREVDGLSDTAFRLHVTAIFWCAANRTDGLVPEDDLDLVSARVRAPSRFAAECVRRGAWHEARHDCGSRYCAAPLDADGWVVHDYLRDNPSREELEAGEAAMDAGLAGMSGGGKRGNHRRWHEQRGVVSPGCEFCAAPVAAGARAGPAAKRASGTRSLPDRVPESGANPISRPDLDFDLDKSPVSQSRSRSGAQARGDSVPDPEPEPGTGPFRLRVAAAIAGVTGTEVDDATADAITADILAGAKGPVPHRLGYVLKSIRQEASPRARWLPRGPARPAAGRPAHCGDRECIPGTRRREDPETGADLGPCPKCSGTAPAWKATS